MEASHIADSGVFKYLDVLNSTKNREHGPFAPPASVGYFAVVEFGAKRTTYECPTRYDSSMRRAGQRSE
jgi:hypothetical protein